MSMTRTALKTDLQRILGDAAQKFAADAGAFDRHLDLAALALARKTRRTLSTKLSLIAGLAEYPAPADIIDVKFSPWSDGGRQLKPWQGKLGPYPRPSLIESGGTLTILLSPAPTPGQVAVLGSDYPLFYYAAYQITDVAGETNIAPQYRDLLLIRATVQALLELANMGIAKPVVLGSAGVGSMPKNGTPAALAESWLAIFDGGR